MTLSNALLLGSICVAWSAAIGLRQVLLGPNAVNFPSVSTPYRVMLFICSGALLARGVDLLIGALSNKPQEVSALGLVTNGLLAATAWLSLVETLHKRLPAATWRRIRRMIFVANCESFVGMATARLSGRPQRKVSDEVVNAAVARQKIQFKRRHR